MDAGDTKGPVMGSVKILAPGLGFALVGAMILAHRPLSTDFTNRHNKRPSAALTGYSLGFTLLESSGLPNFSGSPIAGSPLIILDLHAGVKTKKAKIWRLEVILKVWLQRSFVGAQFVDVEHPNVRET